MIIKPIRDKKTKKVLTNVEIVRRVRDELKELADGDPNDSTATKLEKKARLDRITGGHTKEVMDWLDWVCSSESDEVAQSRIEKTILPVR